jgi:hypothetical protein
MRIVTDIIKQYMTHMHIAASVQEHLLLVAIQFRKPVIVIVSNVVVGRSQWPRGSKTVCDCSLTGIAGSNPVGGIEARLL